MGGRIAAGQDCCVAFNEFDFDFFLFLVVFELFSFWTNYCMWVG
jgi:hypothetical protein